MGFIVLIPIFFFYKRLECEINDGEGEIKTKHKLPAGEPITWHDQITIPDTDKRETSYQPIDSSM